MNAQEVVEKYFKSWTSKDFKTARSVLADNISFSGPIDTFHSADDLIKSIEGLAQMLKGVETNKVFVSGNDVAHFYTLKTPMGDAPVAELYTVKNGKIASMQAIFDARPFADMGNK